LRTAADILLFAAGVAVAGLTLLSAVRSTNLPRAAQDRLARLSLLAVRALFRLRVGRSADYHRRDRVMAMLAPVTLLVLLSTWILALVGAYTLMYLAVATDSVTKAIELSGSSIVTLGDAVPSGLGANLVSYSEAALGLLLLALLITYLPSIYGAFARRELGVSLLRVRAGDPPQATTMLIRYHRIDESHSRLRELWQSWETWFAELDESHTSFPILAFFRSPQPEQSWVTAAGALLDGASLWVSAVEHPADPEAQLCIRAGFQALGRVAATLGLHEVTEPSPDDPIAVNRSEWERAVDELVAAGVPVLTDRERMWRDWRGWRVNYDTVLLDLARLVEAPPAPWVSDRSSLGGGRRWRGSR